jgi:hypothetical protein
VGDIAKNLDALRDSPVGVDEAWGEGRVQVWREARPSKLPTASAPNRISPADRVGLDSFADAA